MAVPFVEGQIRNEALSARISTQCAHCAQPLHIQLDSDLNFAVEESGAEPLVFSPDVDFKRLQEPNIIHAY